MDAINRKSMKQGKKQTCCYAFKLLQVRKLRSYPMQLFENYLQHEKQIRNILYELCIYLSFVIHASENI